MRVDANHPKDLISQGLIGWLRMWLDKPVAETPGFEPGVPP